MPPQMTDTEEGKTMWARLGSQLGTFWVICRDFPTLLISKANQFQLHKVYFLGKLSIWQPQIGMVPWGKGLVLMSNTPERSLFQMQRDSERRTECSHMLVHFPNACNSWDWAGSKQGAGNLIRSPVESEKSNHRTSTAASQCLQGSDMESRARMRLEPRHSDMEFGHPKWHLN